MIYFQARQPTSLLAGPLWSLVWLRKVTKSFIAYTRCIWGSITE